MGGPRESASTGGGVGGSLLEAEGGDLVRLDIFVSVGNSR